MAQASILREGATQTSVVGSVSVDGVRAGTKVLAFAWFLLVFFGAMPFGFLDLGWIIHGAESAAGVSLLSGVLGNVASVASVRYLAFGIAFAIGLWGTRWRSQSWPTVHVVLLTYSLWAAASVLWSVSPVLGAVKALSLMGCVLVAAALADRPGGLACLVQVTLTAVIAVMATAVIVAIAVPEYGLDPYGDWYPRLGGQLIHPNELAECVGLLLILVLGWPVGWKARTRWGLAAASVAVIAATQSRTTMLALVVVGAVGFITRIHPVIRALSIGLGALAILVLGVSDLDMQGMLGYLGRGSTEDIGDTIAQRVELWEYGLQQSLGSLLIGQGFAVGSRIVLGPAFWWRPVHAHNLALEILLNLGLVGALIAGVTIILAVRSMLRLTRLDGDWGRRGAVGLTLLAFVGALGVTERSFGGELSSAVIGFILAVVIAGKGSDGVPAADDPRPAQAGVVPSHPVGTAPA